MTSPAPDTVVSKPRTQVDPSVLMARSIAGVKPDAAQAEDDSEVQVNVPKAFTLTDDGHEKHEYTPGKQKMLKRHAEHFYAQANGVTIEAD